MVCIFGIVVLVMHGEATILLSRVEGCIELIKVWRDTFSGGHLMVKFILSCRCRQFLFDFHHSNVARKSIAVTFPSRGAITLQMQLEVCVLHA